MPLNERQYEDLLVVVAGVSAAVPGGDPDKARSLITGTEDHLAAFGNHRLDLAGHGGRDTLCSHHLEIVDGEPLLVGGGGVVIPCREATPGKADSGQASVRYALKVARPSLFVGDDLASQAEEREKARAEYDIHLPLAHENIAKMYSLENVTFKVKNPSQRPRFLEVVLPCTLIEWVDGAMPFDAYVWERITSAAEVSDVLTQTFSAIAHLHDAKMIHWDMKSDNLLVSLSGQVKLMDLGNARPLREQGDTYEEDDAVESTHGHVPTELEARLEGPAETEAKPASSNRTPYPLRAGEPVWDRPWLDLHMVAREVNRVIGFDRSLLQGEASYASRLPDIQAWGDKTFKGEEGGFLFRCLKVLLRRLVEADSPTGNPYYSGAHDVLEALSRLHPEYGAGTDVPELQAVPQHVLRIPPCDNVPWTPRIRSLMNTSTVRRLKGHRQLATVRHVFPGAEHTRWEHTAGTLGRILELIRSLYADRHSVRFRLDTSKLDLTAMMLATLLHDVGHPALGHQLEESPLITQERRHEAFALALLAACREENGGGMPEAAEIRQVIKGHWCQEIELDALIARTIELLQGALAETPGSSEVDDEHRLHLTLLHSLISGPLDADKSDYLARDAHHCGVEYASGVDRKRLDQSLRAHI